MTIPILHVATKHVENTTDISLSDNTPSDDETTVENGIENGDEMARNDSAQDQTEQDKAADRSDADSSLDRPRDDPHADSPDQHLAPSSSRVPASCQAQSSLRRRA
jgi:hypothetical protein